MEEANCLDPELFGCLDNDCLSLDVSRTNSSLENSRDDLGGSGDHIDKRLDVFCANVC